MCIPMSIFMLLPSQIKKFRQIHVQILKDNVQYIVKELNLFGVNDVGVTKFVQNLNFSLVCCLFLSIVFIEELLNSYDFTCLKVSAFVYFAI